VLGVPPDAALEEVESAYLEKSHADAGGQDSIEKQIRLLAAYQELMEGSSGHQQEGSGEDEVVDVDKGPGIPRGAPHHEASQGHTHHHAAAAAAAAAVAAEEALAEQLYLPYGSGPLEYEVDADRGNVLLAGVVAVVVAALWMAIFEPSQLQQELLFEPAAAVADLRAILASGPELLVEPAAA